jgi:RNA polymerase sigma-54 factor
MAFELRQELRLTQQLVMTPQLQQAIKLLQLSRLELVDSIAAEIESNPVLECAVQEDGRAQSPDTDGAVGSPDADGMGGAAGAADAPEKRRELDWETYMAQAGEEPRRGQGLNFSDYSGDDGEADFMQNVASGAESLRDGLLAQLKLSGLSGDEFSVGEFIIGNIDDDGYLRMIEGARMDSREHEDAVVSEVASHAGVGVETVNRALDAIQGFDPPGVGARSTGECLLLQARRLPVRDTVVEEIISRHLAELANKNYKAIASRLGISFEEVIEAARFIVERLSPAPCVDADDACRQTVVPDVHIRKMGGEYVVTLNDDGLPRLKISPYYRALMNGNGADGGSGVSAQAREYIQERFKSALWLIKSVHQRQRTILKVVESIVRFQREFLDHGTRYLKPLTLKDVAEDVGVHESTVSRVTSNKYADTPRGTLKLKYFFSTAMSASDGTDVAAEYIKNKLKEVIDAEDAKSPLSDMKIVEVLKEHGIVLSRRTATKYRESLGYLSSHKRKSYL